MAGNGILGGLLGGIVPTIGNIIPIAGLLTGDGKPGGVEGGGIGSLLGGGGNAVSIFTDVIDLLGVGDILSGFGLGGVMGVGGSGGALDSLAGYVFGDENTAAKKKKYRNSDIPTADNALTAAKLGGLAVTDTGYGTGGRTRASLPMVNAVAKSTPGRIPANGMLPEVFDKAAKLSSIA